MRRSNKRSVIKTAKDADNYCQRLMKIIDERQMQKKKKIQRQIKATKPKTERKKGMIQAIVKV